MTGGREERRLTLAELEETLKDPELVYLNMLRGGIAKPSIRQMLHLHGADALARWDSVEETAALRAEVAALRAAVGSAADRLVDPWERYDNLFAMLSGMRDELLGNLTPGAGERALRCVRAVTEIARRLNEAPEGVAADEAEAAIASAARLFGTGDSK